MESLGICTRWNFECYNKHGEIKWAEMNRPNIITAEGLNKLMEIMFRGYTQVTDHFWFIAPVETNTAAVGTQTYEVPLYTEWDGYSEAARQAYVTAAASGGSITSVATKATFTSTEDKTLYGAALVGGPQAGTWKDKTAGNILFSYSKFSTSRGVEIGDTFKVSGSITIASI
jgi:hypothetical protein